MANLCDLVKPCYNYNNYYSNNAHPLVTTSHLHSLHVWSPILLKQLQTFNVDIPAKHPRNCGFCEQTETKHAPQERTVVLTCLWSPQLCHGASSILW